MDNEEEMNDKRRDAAKKKFRRRERKLRTFIEYLEHFTVVFEGLWASD